MAQLLEANIQKVAFEGMIRNVGTSNVITIPRTFETLGFGPGVTVRVIIEKTDNQKSDRD